MLTDTSKSIWRTVTVDDSHRVYWLVSPAADAAGKMVKIDRNDSRGRARVINRYAECWTDVGMRARLELYGLPVSDRAAWNAGASLSDGKRYVRTVTLWVYGFEVVAAGIGAYAPSGSSFIQPIHEWNRPPYRRLARMAVRAAYALGYETLQVTLQAAADSASSSETVDDHPAGVLDEPQQGDMIVSVLPVSERVPQWVWEQYMRKLKQESEIVRCTAMNRGDDSESSNSSEMNRVQYGMDCEFILYDEVRQRMLSASYFLPINGTAGCDAVRIKGRVHYPLMELRPAPAYTPSQLVKHLQLAMREADRSIQQSDYVNPVSWYAGSYPLGRLPIGCHVHISGVPLHPELIRALDTYVSLPLALLEPASLKQRRPAYGTLGDVRLHDHGGAGGFEYRTLPNFALTPELTLDVLQLFDAVIMNYACLHRRDAAEDKWLRSFMSGRKNERYRETSIRILRELEEQCTKKSHVSSIRRLIGYLDEGWHWDEHSNVRDAWLRERE
ncbi:putative amidoligase domain-containing protein [Paenibacillus marinisediminis]